MIEWILTSLGLNEMVSDVSLKPTLTESLKHYDPVAGIEVMAIGSTFIVG